MRAPLPARRDRSSSSPCRGGGPRRRTASPRGSCVTITTVLPNSRRRSRSSESTSTAFFASRSPVGSSATTISGSVTIARAIATRCCSPPESSPGMCVARSPSPTTRSARRGALAPLVLAELGEQQRQLDVLARGEHRDQVEELEHEADVLGAEARELVLGQLVQHAARDRRRWPSFGAVESREQVEQRRFAGARRTHQRHEPPALDAQRDVLERVHLVGAAAVDPRDVLDLDQSGSRWRSREFTPPEPPRRADRTRRRAGMRSARTPRSPARAGRGSRRGCSPCRS